MNSLINIFSDAETGNAFIFLLRFITSAYLKNNKEFFEGFTEGYLTVDEFC